MTDYPNEQWAHDLDTLSDMQVLAATVYGMLLAAQQTGAVFAGPEYDIIMGRLRKIMDTPPGAS